MLERHTENFNLGKSWLIGDQTSTAVGSAEAPWFSRARDKWRTNKSRHWLVNSRTSLFFKCDRRKSPSVTTPAPAGNLPLSHHIRLLPSKFRRDFVILGDCGL